jgi:DNA-directed RNA polymerase subunit RPC12/RpoP
MALNLAQAETRERRCPTCQSERILHGGEIFGGEGLIKAEHRCETCKTAFLFVRKRAA